DPRKSDRRDRASFGISHRLVPVIEGWGRPRVGGQLSQLYMANWVASRRAGSPAIIMIPKVITSALARRVIEGLQLVCIPGCQIWRATWGSLPLVYGTTRRRWRRRD